MARPGIMVYFNIKEPLSALSDAERGILLTAMLEYGETGALPEFHGMLALAWSFVRPMIDKDGQRYDDMKLQREYAIFCKKRKRIFMPKILFDDWIVMSEDERQRAVDPVLSRSKDQRAVDFDNERQRTVNLDNERLPTTVTTAMYSEQCTVNSEQCTVNNEQCTVNSMQLQSSMPNNNPQTQGCGEGEDEDGDGGEESKVVRAVGGTLGKGVVFMSDEQVADLLDRMGIEAFDHYVGKLSDFILKNGARVKSHYETILKWWREDSAVQG